MEYKKNLYERLNDTIDIIKINYKQLLLPFFVLNLLYFATNMLLVLFFTNTEIFQKILEIVHNPDIVKTENLGIFIENIWEIFVIFGSFIGAFLLFLYFSIPVFIMGFTIMKATIEKKNMTLSEILKCGFEKLSGVLKVYLYIFYYVYLFPLLVFFIGCLFLAVQQFTSVGIFLLFIWTIGFIYCIIYRGIQSIFSLYYALENNDFSYEGYKKQMKLTYGKKYRIFWEVLLIGLMIGGLGSIISAYVSGILSGIFSFSIYLDVFFTHIVSNILDCLQQVVILIFMYLFYKRLEFEMKNTQENYVMKDNEL